MPPPPPPPPPPPAPMFRDNYYDKDKINDFLRTYCEKLIIKGEQTDALTKLIDYIIYPQAQDIIRKYVTNPQDKDIIKNYDFFKKFKSLPIKDKKEDHNFGELFKSRDTLLRKLKKLRKNKGKEFDEYKKISGNNFNENQDIIGELEKLKEKKGKLNKDKLEHFKEIIIAAFTDHMRDDILSLIKSIETDINERMYNAGIKGYAVLNSKESVGERNPVRIVISGGSGFNNLIDINERPISPDIDVKLCLHTQEAIALHNHMTQVIVIEDIKSLQIIQMEVAKQLLIVRTHLFNVMEDKAKEISVSIKSKVNELNRLFNMLREHCEQYFNKNKKEIPFLNTLKSGNESWYKNFNVFMLKIITLINLINDLHQRQKPFLSLPIYINKYRVIIYFNPPP
jgi:hypothetical protein